MIYRVLLLVGPMLACSNTLDTPQSTDEQLLPPYEAPYSATVPTRLILREFNTALAQRRRMVVRSQAELKAIWAEVYARRAPMPAVPLVDFERNTVLVAAMGQRNSGGHSIEFTQIATAGGNLAVTVTEVAPGAKCGVTGALTSPIVILSVPKIDGHVQFIDFEEVRRCN